MSFDVDRYVVFLENGDNYFDRLLFTTENSQIAHDFCNSFDSLVDGYLKLIRGQYSWIHDRYIKCNPDGMSREEVLSLWWEDVVGTTSEKWVGLNCNRLVSDTLLNTFSSVIEVLEGGYSVRHEICKELK